MKQVLKLASLNIHNQVLVTKINTHTTTGSFDLNDYFPLTTYCKYLLFKFSTKKQCLAAFIITGFQQTGCSVLVKGHIIHDLLTPGGEVTP